MAKQIGTKNKIQGPKIIRITVSIDAKLAKKLDEEREKESRNRSKQIEFILKSRYNV